MPRIPPLDEPERAAGQHSRLDFPEPAQQAACKADWLIQLKLRLEPWLILAMCVLIVAVGIYAEEARSFAPILMGGITLLLVMGGNSWLAIRFLEPAGFWANEIGGALVPKCRDGSPDKWDAVVASMYRDKLIEKLKGASRYEWRAMHKSGVLLVLLQNKDEKLRTLAVEHLKVDGGRTPQEIWGLYLLAPGREARLAALDGMGTSSLGYTPVFA